MNDIISDILYNHIFKGDIGQWLPNGTMKIIDRRQTILKLAQVSSV